MGNYKIIWIGIICSFIGAIVMAAGFVSVYKSEQKSDMDKIYQVVGEMATLGTPFTYNDGEARVLIADESYYTIFADGTDMTGNQYVLTSIPEIKTQVIDWLLKKKVKYNISYNIVEGKDKYKWAITWKDEYFVPYIY